MVRIWPDFSGASLCTLANEGDYFWPGFSSGANPSWRSSWCRPCPKARVLGVHAGSAGLFSTIRDMEFFLEHYLQDPFAEILSQNYA